jgi:response regulator RpfG family c-di-GMP phosphodiesterase
MHDRLHVLLVEDQPDCVDFLVALLGTDNDLRVAPDTATAVNAAQQDPPDVVVLDVHSTDPAETVNRIRQLDTKKRPLCVAVTDENRLGGIDGIDLYLRRPLFQEPVRNLLRRFRRIVTD